MALRLRPPVPLGGRRIHLHNKLLDAYGSRLSTCQGTCRYDRIENNSLSWSRCGRSSCGRESMNVVKNSHMNCGPSTGPCPMETRMA